MTSKRLKLSFTILLIFSCGARSKVVQHVDINHDQISSRLVISNNSVESLLEDAANLSAEVKKFYVSLLPSEEGKLLSSETEAKELFERIKERYSEKIPFDFSQDACFARAHTLANRLHKEGYRTGKIWLKALSLYSPLNDSWSYHVAPIVYMKIDDNIEPFVFEIAPWFDKPVSVREWLAMYKIKYENRVEYPLPKDIYPYQAVTAYSSHIPYWPGEVSPAISLSETRSDAKKFNYNTSLHSAVNNNDESKVRALLEKKSSVLGGEITEHHASLDGRGVGTILHVAVMHHLNHLVELLLEKAPELVNNPQLAKNRFGDTPLHIAVQNNSKEVTRTLLKAPSLITDMNLVRNAKNEGPLHVATHFGFDEIVEILLNEAPLLATDARLLKNSFGYSPLHLAVYNGHKKIVKSLLKKAPQMVTSTNNDGDTALHLAVHMDDEESVRLLLSLAPQIAEVQNEKGKTVYHVAVTRDSLDIMNMLLAEVPHVAEFDDSKGNTPLHIATTEGNVAMIKLLLAKVPILVDRKNKKGETALDVAVRKNYAKIQKLLQQ